MTSIKKVEANRANARKSTGPKSARGRSRASKNARQHGLSVAVSCDLAFADRICLLAREICGSLATTRESAIHIAEAQVDLIRIRTVKQRLMQQLHGLQTNESYTDQAKCSPASAQSSDIDQLLRELVRLDRYERRALSRRRKAIRSYDTMENEVVVEVPFNLAERSQKDQ